MKIIELHTFDTEIGKHGEIKTLYKLQSVLASSIFTIMEATVATKKQFRNDHMNIVVQIRTPDGRIVPIPAYNSYLATLNNWMEYIDKKPSTDNKGDQ